MYFLEVTTETQISDYKWYFNLFSLLRNQQIIHYRMYKLYISRMINIAYVALEFPETILETKPI